MEGTIKTTVRVSKKENALADKCAKKIADTEGGSKHRLKNEVYRRGLPLVAQSLGINV